MTNSKASIVWISRIMVLATITVVLNYARSWFSFTFVSWGVNFSIITLCLYFAASRGLFWSKQFIACSLFLMWALLGIIRGIPEINNYWQAKQMIYGIMCVSLPCFSYVFSNPQASILILRTWNKWMFPLFFVWFSWYVRLENIHFYMGFIYTLYAVFFIWMSNKWKFLTTIIIVLMLVGDLGARSQMIKAAFTIGLTGLVCLNKFIPLFAIKLSSWLMYFFALLFLILGLSGTYNIFDHTDHLLEHEIVFNEGRIIEGKNNKNLVDTRTFIYAEVINSAFENDYVEFGRTLARGNDSLSFGDKSLTGEQERYANELCFLNIFTWLGLFGVLLYSFIYFIASFLALYFSNSKYLKYLGLLVAFHWAFGWIEDVNTFIPMNFALWMIIGMCLSPQFRDMTDLEYKLWFKSLFCSDQLLPYYKYHYIKSLLRLRLYRIINNNRSNIIPK